MRRHRHLGVGDHPPERLTESEKQAHWEFVRWHDRNPVSRRALPLPHQLPKIVKVARGEGGA